MSDLGLRLLILLSLAVPESEKDRKPLPPPAPTYTGWDEFMDAVKFLVVFAMILVATAGIFTGVLALANLPNHNAPATPAANACVSE